MSDKGESNLGVILALVGLIMAVVAVVLSLAYRVPGPAGPQGEKGDLGLTGDQGIPGTSVPIGAVVPFFGDPNIISKENKDNWLICDGRLIRKEDYPQLHSVLAELYGEEGEYRRIPNLSGLFIRGTEGKVFTVGKKDGQDSIPNRSTQPHTLTIEQMPIHSHTTIIDRHDYRGGNSGGGSHAGDSGGKKRTGNAGGNQPHYHGINAEDNRPKFISAYYLIRAR